MLETIIVIGIVSLVAFMAGRSFYRTMTGQNDRCGCQGDCPYSKTCKEFSSSDHGRNNDQ